MANENEMQLGFRKRSARAGATYFRIFENMLCQTQKVESEDSKIDGWEGPVKTQHPRTKKDVWTCLIKYDSLAAYVIDAERFKKEFTPEQGGGKISGLSLTLDAGGTKGVLQLNWQQTGPEPVLKRFLKVAPNIDFEKPLLISAWRNRAGKQAVSFRQGTDPDPEKWDKVDEYWKRDKDPVTDTFSGDAKGADGTILPPPEHDEFEDSWDYSAQNKFLMQYFVQNIEPRVKAIAAKHNLAPSDGNDPNIEDGSDESTMVSNPAPLPEVTELPANPKATSIGDAITGQQRATIKAQAKTLGMDFEAQCPQLLGCSFDELSKQAGQYAIFRLTEALKAKGLDVPAQAPVEEAPPVAPPTADWGSSGSAPASSPAESSAPEDKAPWEV